VKSTPSRSSTRSSATPPTAANSPPTSSAVSPIRRWGRALRANGAETAERYTWDNALTALDRKIAYVDAVARALKTRAGPLSSPAAAAAIGAAVVRQASAAGYTCAFTYVRDGGAAGALVAEIAGAGRRAIAIKADIASEDDIVAGFRAADDAFAR